MDYPKPFLKYNSTTFIDKLIREYNSAEVSPVVVVINKDLYSHPWLDYIKPLLGKAEFIVNPYPERGRFYSIKLGFEAIERCDHCFIQNIDNPFTDRQLLSLLMENKIKHGYTLPVYLGKGGHPVLISHEIMRQIKETENIANLRNLLNHFERKEVKVNRDDILININTPEDYDLYVTEKEVIT